MPNRCRGVSRPPKNPASCRTRAAQQKEAVLRSMREFRDWLSSRKWKVRFGGSTRHSHADRPQLAAGRQPRPASLNARWRVAENVDDIQRRYKGKRDGGDGGREGRANRGLQRKIRKNGKLAKGVKARSIAGPMAIARREGLDCKSAAVEAERDRRSYDASVRVARGGRFEGPSECAQDRKRKAKGQGERK